MPAMPEISRDHIGYVRVTCGPCGSSSGIRPPSDPDGEAKVIAAWNRRASPTPPTTEGREALGKMDSRLAPVPWADGGMAIMGPDGTYWPFPLNEWAQQRWAAWCQKAKAALTAYESHLEAEGMAVVPVKPTPDMMMAGLQSMTVSTNHNGYADHIWAAMLSASPYGKASMQEASAERAARSEQIPPGKEESK